MRAPDREELSDEIVTAICHKNDRLVTGSNTLFTAGAALKKSVWVLRPSVRRPTSLGRNRAWPLSPQGSDRSYGPAIRGDIAYRTNLYLNRTPSASMSPVVGCGKWIGKTYLPVPAISVRNFRRDRAACAGSHSKIVDQSSSRHCKTWCKGSPITTACCPRERILTQQWWGEWPGVGTSQNVSSS